MQKILFGASTEATPPEEAVNETLEAAPAKTKSNALGAGCKRDNCHSQKFKNKVHTLLDKETKGFESPFSVKGRKRFFKDRYKKCSANTFLRWNEIAPYMVPLGTKKYQIFFCAMKGDEVLPPPPSPVVGKNYLPAVKVAISNTPPNS